MTDLQICRARFLEWLYDRGGDVDVADFYRAVADDESVPGWRDVVRSTADDGHIRLHESLATTNGALRLLPSGRAWVESLRGRRGDRGLRHAALQTAILLWLRTGREDVVAVEDFPADAHFEGAVYESWERERAWEALQQRSLVSGTDSAHGLYFAQLTADGRDCVDQFGGSVSEYLHAQQRPSNSVTVHGSNSGNIASGNRDVMQTAATSTGLDTAGIADIMRAVVEIAGRLDLPEPERAELVRTAESAQYELSAQDPDVSQIRALGGKVIRMLGRTAGSVLPSVLTKYLEIKLGLDPAS